MEATLSLTLFVYIDLKSWSDIRKLSGLEPSEDSERINCIAFLNEKSLLVTSNVVQRKQKKKKKKEKEEIISEGSVTNCL